MKKLMCMLLLACAGATALAQSTKVIKGAVVDKNGNPLPGAQVEATGGAESTTTDADGTFSLEVPMWLKSATARYAGMRDKKLKTSSSDMIFRMKKDYGGGWFVSAVGSLTLGDWEDSPTGKAGVMGGYLGNWGGYVKSMWFCAGAEEPAVPMVSAGVIKRICRPLYAYLGVGYTKALCDDEYWDWGYDYWWVDEEDAAVFEAGFIYKPIPHLMLSLGYAVSPSFCCAVNHDIMLGVGFCF